MDAQLLSRWFKQGYSSREMATFHLLSELTTDGRLLSPNQVAERWAELHQEVCRLVFTK